MGGVRYAFFRRFFRLLYNEFAWSYDLVAWLVSLGRWKAWGRTTLSHTRGQRVLELGHGPGHLLTVLAARGLSAVGLDLSTNMVSQARRRIQATGLSVPVVQGRAQMLPFRRASFDTILATFPSAFIVHPQTLREARRVLAPKGCFIVAVAAQFEGTDIISRFLAWLYRVTGQNQPPVNAFTRRLEQAGWLPRVVWEEVKNTKVMLVVLEKN